MHKSNARQKIICSCQTLALFLVCLASMATLVGGREKMQCGQWSAFIKPRIHNTLHITQRKNSELKVRKQHIENMHHMSILLHNPHKLIAESITTHADQKKIDLIPDTTKTQLKIGVPYFPAIMSTTNPYAMHDKEYNSTLPVEYDQYAQYVSALKKALASAAPWTLHSDIAGICAAAKTLQLLARKGKHL